MENDDGIKSARNIRCIGAKEMSSEDTQNVEWINEAEKQNVSFHSKN